MLLIWTGLRDEYYIAGPSEIRPSASKISVKFPKKNAFEWLQFQLGFEHELHLETCLVKFFLMHLDVLQLVFLFKKTSDRYFIGWDSPTGQSRLRKSKNGLLLGQSHWEKILCLSSSMKDLFKSHPNSAQPLQKPFSSEHETNIAGIQSFKTEKEDVGKSYCTTVQPAEHILKIFSKRISG